MAAARTPKTGTSTTYDSSVDIIKYIDVGIKHLEDMQTMAQEFFEKRLLIAVEASQRERKMETDRIDACRRDDTEAVKVANAMADKKAEMLATSVAESAETLRAGMAKTAETLASQSQQMITALDSRLKIVEEKQYSLAGASKGSRDMWGWVSAGVVLIIAVIGFFLKW